MGERTFAPQVGDVIEQDKYSYRIIRVALDYLVIMQILPVRGSLSYMPLKDLEALFLTGKVSVKKRPNNFIVDMDSLSEEVKNAFYARREIIRLIQARYGPDYMELNGHRAKPFLKEICEKYEISRATLWRYIWDWLGSGLDEYALLDKRIFNGLSMRETTVKTGRPATIDETDINVAKGLPKTTAVLQQFEEGVRFFKKGRYVSIKEAYQFLCGKYYTNERYGIDENEPIYIQERPTLAQFRYYLNTRLTSEEKKIAKTSAREYRNAERARISDTRYLIAGALDRVQIDEWEADVSVRSSYHSEISVGRPIVYAMMDSYSKLILAVSITYNNNSVLGLTQCLLNLADDKVSLCKRYGIAIMPEAWPSKVLPYRLLSDQGSEYLSHECRRILKEFHIDDEVAPAATGSMKGDIEQFFNQLKLSIRSSVYKHGFIDTTPQSKHHEQATLTLDEFTAMVYSYVIHHNTHELEEYQIDADMHANGVRPVPAMLYQYSCERFGPPRPITNLAQYYYSLLTPVKATINDHGICAEHLVYNDPRNPELAQMIRDTGRRTKTFSCRMDPRDVGCVYYINERKQLVPVPLTDLRTGFASFAGITLTVWRLLYKNMKELSKKGKNQKDVAESQLKEIYRAIVKNASKRAPVTSTKNILENRRIESNLLNNSNAILFKLCEIAQVEPEAIYSAENLGILYEPEGIVVDTVMTYEEHEDEDDFSFLSDFRKK